ncbi:hypothetical protein [Chondromyces crocatus]|uniref:hypothetical protein n=1 Tax=Chondromyces crocatus TaxID=52 RepID=UPI00067B989A|nr:hypothetical protein [Chondromyces crocatus]
MLAATAIALASFGLGLLAARQGDGSGPASAPPEPSTSSSFPNYVVLDAGKAEPRIALDPDRVELLPDASLRLDLPDGFGGGSP